MFTRQVVHRLSVAAGARPTYGAVFRALSSYPTHKIVGMPSLSPTMEVGTIGKWLVKPGDEISAGVALAEVETDKASMTFEAQEDFFIAKLLVDAGAEVKIGQPIFVSVEDASSVGAFANFVLTNAPAAAAAAPAVAAAPAPAPVPVVAPKVAAPAPAAAPVKAAPAVAAPKPVPAPQAAPPKPAAAAPASTFKWGSSVKKSAIYGRLAAQHAGYLEKYGRSAQKPL